MKIVLEDCIEYRNELGQLHREDGPAIKWNDRDVSYTFNGTTHNLTKGAREYWVNGQLFRIEYANGSKAYYNGTHLHRLDGPALEYAWCPEHNRYYIDGKQVPSF
jgi:hypothetical protein